jgi:hypothetical protein
MEKLELTSLEIAERVKYQNAPNTMIDQSGTTDLLATDVSNAVRFVFGALIDSALSGEIIQVKKVLVTGSEDIIIQALPVTAGIVGAWIPGSEFDPREPWVVLQAGENLRIAESLSGGITATVWYWDR